MIYIDTQSNDVYYNFAAEYYLAARKRFEDRVFMLWQTEPTLMIGRYQNAAQEIDMNYVMNKKYHIVRRASGGGTIYTDGNAFQYTFIAPNDSGDFSFETFISPVVSGLHKLGVQAALNRRNDLLIGEKKVSGIAQYVASGYTVHHGSVLYNVDIAELERCLTVDVEKMRSKGIQSVRERVTNVAGYLSEAMPIQQFLERLKEEVLDRNAVEYVLTAEDQKAIEEIAEKKFRSWEWCFGRAPECDFVKSQRLKGGKIEVHLKLNEGCITECYLEGDFFAGQDMDCFRQALVGCPYDLVSVTRRLQQLEAEKYIYQVSLEELVHCII